MFASVYILASFVIEQLTPKCIREVRDVTKDAVFALEEARLCQDFARYVRTALEEKKTFLLKKKLQKSKIIIFRKYTTN